MTPYRETHDALGELLILAVRGGHQDSDMARLRALHAGLADQEIVKAAAINKVTHAVGDALDRALGSTLSVTWRNALDANEARVESLLDLAAELSRELTNSGIVSAAVESAGVLVGSDLPTRALGSGDLDLLVPEATWSASLQVASELGLMRGERSGQVTTRRAKLSAAGPSGETLWIEACAHPFERNWVPLRVHDRCSVWLDRVVPSRKRPEIGVLDPHDALAFVALHTSLHSFIRSPGLRLHMDVDRLARDNPIDWGRVVGEVEALGVRTRAFVSFMMARGLLDTPIPDGALEALAPSPSRWEHLRELLQGEGILSDGGPKLGPAQTLRLDMLLAEGGVGSWLTNAALPKRAWLQRRFAPEEPNLGLARLHGRRLMRLVTRWRPQ